MYEPVTTQTAPHLRPIVLDGQFRCGNSRQESHSLLARLLPFGLGRQLFDSFVKIAAGLVGLLNLFALEFLVFRLGYFLCHLVRDFSRMIQNGALVQGQEAMEFGDPVAHVQGGAAHGLTFSKDEVLLNEVVMFSTARDTCRFSSCRTIKNSLTVTAACNSPSA